jgi:isocitrate lyase
MTDYKAKIDHFTTLCQNKDNNWQGINPEFASRMHLQNRFQTGLEIAKYTASIMRRDMDAYDADSSQYTQSLGCWHGFTAQQMMMAVKRHQKNHTAFLCLFKWLDGCGTAF